MLNVVDEIRGDASHLKVQLESLDGGERGGIGQVLHLLLLQGNVPDDGAV